MEEENGLELGLSLAMCQSSSKPKDTADNLSDTKAEESDRSSKLINGFKHFLDGGTSKLESATGSHRSDTLKPDERGKCISNDNNLPKVQKNIFFEEINNQIKRERESHNSHISINTDDGSTAENDDVVDSEAVRILSHHDDNGKRYKRGVGPRKIGNDVYTVFDTSAVNVSGQRGFTITPETEFKTGKVPYSVTFPSQSVNILNMPHSIAAMDIHSSYVGRFPPTMDKLNHASSKASLDTAAKPSEFSQSDKLPSELSAITPGIDSDLRFGGCGSYPNLPWVSTKGPNGMTISGVTYRFSPTQIKIVCACHGSHMSPEEFVRHASEEKTGSQYGSDLASLPNNNNPTASAQS